ncbi:flavin reductase family protein [Aquimarina aquimarini]|uniref:flavin reductase family protein n=1 Tax=Aquimarina aquimarini TaxID=1191734 RepID=UPI000D5517A6|nr:flavin reductase family protein [Aquimarina aquimarini]
MGTTIKSITVDESSVKEIHQYLLGIIAPRPIAWVSTISKNGTPNLSPFSFFNVFSANPPILIFSSARRVRNNTTKHTLHNIIEHPEAVINIPNYDLVEQLSLSSTEYPKGVNEFIKSGVTSVASDIVAPPRIKECPASFECKVNHTIPLGKEGGAGHLIIAKVVKIHIKLDVLDQNGKIDPLRFDSIARMGENWYSRIIKDSIFEIPKPIRNIGIGIDQLPSMIQNSTILTGNNLGRLGNVEKLPNTNAIQKRIKTKEIQAIIQQSSKNDRLKKLHLLAKKYLEKGNTMTCLEILMCESLD